MSAPPQVVPCSPSPMELYSTRAVPYHAGNSNYKRPEELLTTVSKCNYVSRREADCVRLSFAQDHPHWSANSVPAMVRPRDRSHIAPQKSKYRKNMSRNFGPSPEQNSEQSPFEFHLHYHHTTWRRSRESAHDAASRSRVSTPITTCSGLSWFMLYLH
jgi:hypothetical protein